MRTFKETIDRDLTNVLSGYVLLNKEGLLMEVSSEIVSFLGYEDQELLQTSLSSLLYNNVALFQSKLNALLHGKGSSFHMEVPLRHKTGLSKWALLVISRIPFEETFMLVGHLTDLSSKKALEERLQRFESLFENTSEGLVVFDLNGRIIMVNNGFEAIFGYSESELTGKRLHITPDESMEEGEFLLQETSKGQFIKDFETIKKRKDGALIPVSVTMSPILNEEGQVAALGGIVRDLTDQKKLISQLESFVENNVDPILIFDRDGKLIRTNRALKDLFGFEPTDVIGLNLDQMPFIPARIKPEIEHMVDLLKRANGANGIESVRQNKEGVEIPVLVSSFPMRDIQDNLIGWAVILKDQTEHKKAEEIMINSEKLTVAGELAAGIAHEILNPITAIKGFISLIKAGRSKASYFDIIDSEMNRIEQILSELLVFAKPRSIKMGTCDIRLILEQAMTLLKAQANMENIEMTFTCNREDVLIECEGNQLKQVFINFIKNAIEAMPNGGKLDIKLQVFTYDDHVQVSFRDTGVGIPKEILPLLGQPFYSTKEKGTGLGFMVSKKIIENHLGALSIISEENKGTTIEVKLPTRQDTLLD